MSEKKNPMEMTRAEYARARREMLTQTGIDAKKEEGERFMEKLKDRHENPPQPIKVKPIENDTTPAPVGNGLSKLF